MLNRHDYTIKKLIRLLMNTGTVKAIFMYIIEIYWRIADYLVKLFAFS